MTFSTPLSPSPNQLPPPLITGVRAGRGSSVVLLICDRESEEIFYKERQIEDEEEEEEAGEA